MALIAANDPPRPTGHPILRILTSFPIAGFTGALIADIAYANSADMMWADFADWLLAVGLLMGALAAAGGCIVLLINRHRPIHAPVALIAAGGALALILAVFDSLVHSRDAWTSVVPTGLILSALTVLATLATAWLGFSSPVDRHAAAYAPGTRA